MQNVRHKPQGRVSRNFMEMNFILQSIEIYNLCCYWNNTRFKLPSSQHINVSTSSPHLAMFPFTKGGRNVRLSCGCRQDTYTTQDAHTTCPNNHSTAAVKGGTVCAQNRIYNPLAALLSVQGSNLRGVLCCFVPKYVATFSTKLTKIWAPYDCSV